MLLEVCSKRSARQAGTSLQFASESCSRICTSEEKTQREKNPAAALGTALQWRPANLDKAVLARVTYVPACERPSAGPMACNEISRHHYVFEHVKPNLSISGYLPNSWAQTMAWLSLVPQLPKLHRLQARSPFVEVLQETRVRYTTSCIPFLLHLLAAQCHDMISHASWKTCMRASY